MIPTVIALTREAADGPAADSTALAQVVEDVNTDELPTHAPTNTAQDVAAGDEVTLDGELVAVETAVDVSEFIPSPEPVDPLHPEIGTIPDAEIIIYRPGELSRLASPFRVVADLPPGPAPDFLVTVELFGEDGRLLVRKLLRVPLHPSTMRTTFVTDIDFEIRAVAETGRIVISTEDEFSRPRALASVDVILVSDGLSDLNFYQDTLENIIIQQPEAFKMVQSAEGILIVTGLARQNGDSPLLIELIDENGKVVGFGNAPFIVPETGEYGLFVGEVKYNVLEPTWVRLVVQTQGGRVPGISHTTSLEVVVSP
jgi:hypothetical protein